MSRLRSYTRMHPVSAKKQREDKATKLVKLRVLERAQYRCEVVPPNDDTHPGTRCARRAQDVHHVVKRSQGGPDTEDNCLAICRDHHDRTDWPYTRGRLVITPRGGGRFTCAIRYAKEGR